jgi:hypothetical protein
LPHFNPYHTIITTNLRQSPSSGSDSCRTQADGSPAKQVHTGAAAPACCTPCWGVAGAAVEGRRAPTPSLFMPELAVNRCFLARTLHSSPKRPMRGKLQARARCLHAVPAPTPDAFCAPQPRRPPGPPALPPQGLSFTAKPSLPCRCAAADRHAPLLSPACPPLQKAGVHACLQLRPRPPPVSVAPLWLPHLPVVGASGGTHAARHAPLKSRCPGCRHHKGETGSAPHPRHGRGRGRERLQLMQGKYARSAQAARGPRPVSAHMQHCTASFPIGIAHTPALRLHSVHTALDPELAARRPRAGRPAVHAAARLHPTHRLGTTAPLRE